MEIKILSIDYNPGDKRTSGAIELKAETPHGLLEFWSTLGTGDDEGELTLDGKPVDIDVDWPDIGLPHHYAGKRAVERAQENLNSWVHDALVAWCNEYKTNGM